MQGGKAVIPNAKSRKPFFKKSLSGKDPFDILLKKKTLNSENQQLEKGGKSPGMHKLRTLKRNDLKLDGHDKKILNSYLKAHSDDLSQDDNSQDSPNEDKHNRAKKRSQLEGEIKSLGGVFYNIKDYFKSGKKPEPYRNSGVSFVSVILNIVFLILYIISTVSIVYIESAHTMEKSISSIIEGRPYNLEGNFYTDIKTKEEIDYFIANVVIDQIYNEELKRYPAITTGYHYINFFNYFCGMRITHNRAEITKNNNGQFETEIVEVRGQNYRGKANKRFGGINTGTWGTKNYNYTKTGGFSGKGGFVHFFESDWDADQAFEYYDELYFEEDLYGGDLISIVIELMFYNENYQTGINIAYEFTLNNGGRTEKYKSVTPFYVSRYSDAYHVNSTTFKSFLIISDILFMMYMVYFAYKIYFPVKRAIYGIFKFQEFNMKWHEVIDIFLLAISIVSMVFWGLIMFNPQEISVPVEDEQHFQQHVDLGYLTYVYLHIASVNFILIGFKCLQALTVKFPAFSALFDTVKIAFTDFTKWYFAIMICFLGFIYMLMLVQGVYVEEVDSFLLAAVYLYYFGFGFTSLDIPEVSVNHSYILKLTMVLFYIIVHFILVKMMASIIITRYMYLRS